jgi:hypothetical protein
VLGTGHCSVEDSTVHCSCSTVRCSAKHSAATAINALARAVASWAGSPYPLHCTVPGHCTLVLARVLGPFELPWDWHPSVGGSLAQYLAGMEGKGA